MARHLLVRLQAPLLAFGGESIDYRGVTRRFPALSMLTGLFGNALGWDRADADKHNRLQARLIMGTRLESQGVALTDFQTAGLGKKDAGWTTSGVPEGRQGGDDTYGSPHLRFRDYYADLHALVALRLEPVDESPTLDDLAVALDHPVRPLFIGRKPCLPSGRLFAGWHDAINVLTVLSELPASSVRELPLQWPRGEGELSFCQAHDICDERNWISGVHGGWRPVMEGAVRATVLQT